MSDTTLINPLFVFSNVVFIRPKQKYILIRREAWNTIVRIVFKRSRPTSQELKSLKSIFYKNYQKWMDSNAKSIDFKSWNKDLVELQKPKVRKVPDSVIEFENFQDQATVKFEEETFFDDEFLDKEMVHNKLDISESQMSIYRNYSSKIEESKADIATIINYNISLSPVHKGLIDFIGYSRLISLSCELRSQEKLKNLSPEMLTFLKANPQFIFSCLKFRNVSVFFICVRCRSLNQHSKRYSERKQDYIKDHMDGDLCYYYKDMKLDDVKISFNDHNVDVTTSFDTVLVSEKHRTTFKPIGYGLDGEDLSYRNGSELVDAVKLYHLVSNYTEYISKIFTEISFIPEEYVHFKEKHFLNSLSFYFDILETKIFRKFFKFHECNIFCTEQNCSFLTSFSFDLSSIEVNSFNVEYFLKYGSDYQKHVALELTSIYSKNLDFSVEK